MADARLPIPRLPPQLLILLLLAAAPCVLGQDRCGGFDCQKNCSLEPQMCDECCSKGSGGVGPAGTGGEKITELERELAEVKDEVGKVKVMLEVLMFLVVILVIGAGTGLILYLRHRCHTFSLPLFLRGKAVRAKDKEANKMDSTKTTHDPTAVRIAHYQNKHSPLSMRRPTATTNPTDDSQGPHFPKQRTRQPSESSSPDDPTTPTTTTTTTTTSTTPDHPHAYHNMGLSTSTLHDTTTSSTSTLGPGISTNTLDTTLASGSMHTTPHSRI